MTIDPLHTGATHSPAEIPRLKQGGQGSSAFTALLDATRREQGTTNRDPQRAALELMRVQMMQSSLALSGDADAAPSPGVRALQSLLAAAAGAPHPLRAPAVQEPAAPAPKPAMTATPDAGAGDIGSTASRFLGTPYRFGGEGGEGIDCSSFVQQVFREYDITLPRTAREQIKVGSDVAPGDLKKGDLVFFHTYASYPSHVGIYLGDGKMIHASSVKGEVTVSDLDTPYYRSRFIGAKRVV